MGKSYLKMERELFIDSSFCVLLLFTTYSKCMYLEPAIFLQLTLTDCENHASLMKGMNFSSLVEKKIFFSSTLQQYLQKPTCLAKTIVTSRLFHLTSSILTKNMCIHTTVNYMGYTYCTSRL